MKERKGSIQKTVSVSPLTNRKIGSFIFSVFLSYRDEGRFRQAQPPLNRTIFEDVFREKLSKNFKPLPGRVRGQARTAGGAGNE